MRLRSNQGKIQPIINNGVLISNQKRIGNQVAQRFAESCPLTLPSPGRCSYGGICHTCPPKVQAKLIVSKPGDKYEQEADRIAEQIMRMSDPQALKKIKSSPKASISLKNSQLNNDRHSSTDHVSSIVNDALRSPGRPLDTSTRAYFEPRFGYDFSNVRVHTDSKAVESARAMNATAYTFGRDVVFDAGLYAPWEETGRRLVAHELAHVIQQSHGLPESGLLITNEISNIYNEEIIRSAATMNGNKYSPAIRHQTSALLRKEASGNFELSESASPFMAVVIGSGTIDGFVTNEAEISKNNEDNLRKRARDIVVLIKSYPGSTVRVIGHTDARGKESHNMVLGQDRASAVRIALIKMGVPAENISTESKGEFELLIKTTKAHPRNRRVEIRFEPFVSPIRSFTSELSLTPPKLVPGEPERIKPLDLRYHPPIPKETSLPPWFWKKLPPLPQSAEPKSILDVIYEKIVDPIVMDATKWLPKEIQEKVLDMTHDAVEKGISKGIRSAAESLGVKDTEALEAIEKAVEAGIKEK